MSTDTTSAAPEQAPTPKGKAPSLSEQAYRELLHRIQLCQLEPGARISERMLAAELNLGISAVRSALARLSAEGLVVSYSRVGYKVSGFTLERIEHVFDAWRVIGHAIVSRATNNATQDDRLKLQQIRVEIERTGGPEELVALIDNVMEEYVQIAANPILGDVFARLQIELRRLYALTLRSPRQHEDMLNLLGTGPQFEKFSSANEAIAAFDTFTDRTKEVIMAAVMQLPQMTQSSLRFS